jgi:hypothetical protein
MGGKPARGQHSGNGRAGRSRARTVDALDLIETIRAVAAAAQSGTLTVRGRAGQERQLYFQDGLIKAVSAPGPESDTLEEALLGSRSFSREEVAAARREAGQRGKSLAEVLLERGAPRGLDAARLLDARTREEAARLAGWKLSSCRFREGQLPGAGAEPYATRLGGGVDPEEILDDLRRAVGKPPRG